MRKLPKQRFQMICITFFHRISSSTPILFLFLHSCLISLILLKKMRLDETVRHQSAYIYFYVTQITPKNEIKVSENENVHTT